MVAKEILEKVAQADQERTLRAIQGLTSGAYEVKVTRQEEGHVAGYVRNGREYGVVLTSEMTTCSCPDSMYRGKTCKHQTMLALHVIQHPREEPTEGERRVIITHHETTVEITLRHPTCGDDQFGFTYTWLSSGFWHEHGSSRIWKEVGRVEKKKQAA